MNPFLCLESGYLRTCLGHKADSKKPPWSRGENLPGESALPPGGDLSLLAVVVTSDGGEVAMLSAVSALVSRGYTLDSRKALKVLGQEKTVCVPGLSALKCLCLQTWPSVNQN